MYYAGTAGRAERMLLSREARVVGRGGRRRHALSEASYLERDWHDLRLPLRLLPFLFQPRRDRVIDNRALRPLAIEHAIVVRQHRPVVFQEVGALGRCLRAVVAELLRHEGCGHRRHVRPHDHLLLSRSC